MARFALIHAGVPKAEAALAFLDEQLAPHADKDAEDPTFMITP